MKRLRLVRGRILASVILGLVALVIAQACRGPRSQVEVGPTGEDYREPASARGGRLEIRALERPEDPIDPRYCSGTFTGFVVDPILENRANATRLLEGLFPMRLQEEGLGGAAVVRLFLDEGGNVAEVTLESSSGHDDLDVAALAVADETRFTPALNRDQRVPLWVSLPMVFATEEGAEAARVPSLSAQVGVWEAEARDRLEFEGPPYAPPGQLRGTVTQAESGKPIVRAQIIIGGIALGTLTDENGTFLLRCAPSGDFEIAAFHPGHEMVAGPVTVPSDGVVEIHFQLQERVVPIDPIIIRSRLRLWP